MDGSVAFIECGPGFDSQSLIDELRRPRSASHVLVHAAGVRVHADALAAMVAASTAPMAATVSPLPVSGADAGEVTAVATDPRLPPPPTIALGCPAACLLSRDALASLPFDVAIEATDWRSALVHLSQRLTHAGWRHVAAPGAVLRWPDEPNHGLDDDAAWSRSMVEQQNGAANEGLSTHQWWAAVQLRQIRIVIDGACLTDAPHNGSQSVVVNVSRALKRTRPDAHVVLAVHKRFIKPVASLVGRDGVAVVARERSVTGFDVVYRPYQLLDPTDLTWLAGAGQRLLVGQLDMIAFSNPSYHPSTSLFHAVRNLQRHTMRFADGVTFISEFGMECALAECPNLELSRCFVVSCGAEPMPSDHSSTTSAVQQPVEQPFIVCMAATFWHKNRQHAIAVFDELCRRNTYEGQLVIVGPEPYYGRSTDEEHRLIAALEPAVRRRVVYLGQVDERVKWWLLGAADLVLYPSIVEGFGLLPFEAAAVGTPSLSHAGSALLEVLGEGPAVVQSWNVHEWADAADKILRSPARAAEVIASVERAASAHSWDGTALRVWDAVHATLARPPATRHIEEGGVRARVADDVSPLATGARLAHFGNRFRSYIARRALALRSRQARWR